MGLGANATPRFTASPVIGMGTISAAEASLTAPANFAILVTGTKNGTRVDRVVIKSVGTTNAAGGMIRLFVHDGTNYFLIAELKVPNVTPSASVESWGGFNNSIAANMGVIDMTDDPENDIFVLPTGYSLRITTERADTFKCFALGASYDDI